MVTTGHPASLRAIFGEYEKFSNASGLKLNADKTERFDVTSADVVPTGQVLVDYCGASYPISSLEQIKINGLILNTDRHKMTVANYELMKEKMERHFREWSKRSLSLLGKIQIIKTFGISQYLYALAVINLEQNQWDEIQKLIFKFIWNKNYNAPPAPHRIKRDIINEKICNGGFGMLKLQEVANAIKLKRFSLMTDVGGHPIADLQRALNAGQHLKIKADIAIDDVTSTSLQTLNKLHRKAYATIPEIEAVGDLVLHRQLLHCKVINMIKPDMIRSIEYQRLRRERVLNVSFARLMQMPADLHGLIYRICYPEIVRHLRTLEILYQGQPIPDQELRTYVYNYTSKSWQRIEYLSSRAIRENGNENQCLNNMKLLNMTPEAAGSLYGKINKLRNIPNKTKLLRLIHGDVYCGARMKKFKMTDNDRCIRCFKEETIKHLLLECPYTTEVWNCLGLATNNVTDIIHGNLTPAELEIRAEIISALVFRKQVLEPQILIRNTIKRFSKGLSIQRGTTQLAVNLATRQNLQGVG